MDRTEHRSRTGSAGDSDCLRIEFGFVKDALWLRLELGERELFQLDTHQRTEQGEHLEFGAHRQCVLRPDKRKLRDQFGAPLGYHRVYRWLNSDSVDSHRTAPDSPVHPAQELAAAFDQLELAAVLELLAGPLDPNL